MQIIFNLGTSQQLSFSDLYSEVNATQSCLTLCNPTDCSPPGSSVHGDSPGKNTGVGCYFLLQCMKVKSESEVTQSCPTLSDPVDCSLTGSSVHGIFQARVLEWGPTGNIQIATGCKTSWPYYVDCQLSLIIVSTD